MRAVKNGHILVVDEADKAPTAVTCILKTLVESGEMHLADGRRIVTGGWFIDILSDYFRSKMVDLGGKPTSGAVLPLKPLMKIYK